MIFKILQTVKEKYHAWRDARFLKKHHCRNWEEYHSNFDPDVWRHCIKINDWYKGYPYVYRIENENHHAYKLIYDCGPGGRRYGFYDVDDWCKENLLHKWRSDGHCVVWDKWSKQWEINELGGSVYIFYAFKDEGDYLHFMLRWA